MLIHKYAPWVHLSRGNGNRRLIDCAILLGYTSKAIVGNQRSPVAVVPSRYLAYGTGNEK